jgi:microcystin-dependent protein
MAVLSTGQSFSSGDQVTAQKLNDIIGQATFTSAADTTDNSTLTLGSSKLKVKDAGITATQLATDAVVETSIQDGAVTSSKLAASAISTIMPTASIMPYAGVSAPTGFLLCAGQSVPVANYSGLHSVIGYTYGGSGASFKIPDLRGRVIAGQDDMGGSSANRLTGQSGGVDGDVLGGSGGAETHTLSTAQIPAHTHSSEAGGGNPTSLGTGANASVNLTVYDTSSKASFKATSTGGDGAHNNVQPTIILNYIIKT